MSYRSFSKKSEWVIRKCRICGHENDPVNEDDDMYKTKCPECGRPMASRFLDVPSGRVMVFKEEAAMKKSGFTLVELLVCVAVLVVLGSGIFFTGRTDGLHKGRKQLRVEAVDTGVAEWAVTDSEGTVAFRWTDGVHHQAMTNSTVPKWGELSGKITTQEVASRTMLGGAHWKIIREDRGVWTDGVMGMRQIGGVHARQIGEDLHVTSDLYDLLEKDEAAQ